MRTPDGMKMAIHSAPESQLIADLPENDSRRVTIHSYTPAVREKWDQFVAAQPGGSPFHLIGWKHVLEKTFGFQAAYSYAERGGEISAIVPLFRISNWVVGKALIAAPLGVYGGICAADAESDEALLEHVKRLAESEQVDYLELRNRSGELLDGFHPNDLYVTFTTQLTNSDANMKGLPKGTRYMIRKGEKANLTSRIGYDQLGAFYDLFANSMRRLGTPVFPPQLFKNIAEEFGDLSHLMVVYHGEMPVSGMLSFLFNGVSMPYYMGASPEAPALAANNFLYWRLMEDATERGMKSFDFGRSKRGTGVYDFKSKWNTKIEPLKYQVYLVRRKTAPNFSPVNPKFQVATRVWQKLPLWLTRQVGPHVVRWFP